MARAQPGESKAPLVIALSFFVLLSLALGGLTVATFGDVEKAREDAKKAAADKDAAQKKEREAAQKMLVYKVAMGVADEKDRADLANATEKDAVRAAHADLVQKVATQVAGAVTREGRELVGTGGGRLDLPADRVLDWPDPTQAAPARVLIDQLVAFYAGQQLERRQAANKSAEADKEREAAKAAKAAYEAAKGRYEQALNVLPQQVQEKLKGFADQADETRTAFAKATEDFTTRLAQDARSRSELELQVRRQAEDLARQAKRLDDQAAKLDERTDPFAYDKPHAKVVRRSGQLVELDVGTADRVKPGLKFAIQPSDTPTRGFDARKRPFRLPSGGTEMRVVAKAQAEVTRNLGPNLCEARIIEGTEAEPIREPVLAGDLAYNAVWRKGEADHVALLGIFDLNGDGTDDIRRLAADLTAMGIVVDAYYDLAACQWVGKLTDKTLYVVRGSTPFTDSRPGEPAEFIAAKSALLDDLKKAQEDVRKTTASLVRMRDFFPRAGLPANLDVDERRVNQAAAKYLKPAGPAPSAAGDGSGF